MAEVYKAWDARRQYHVAIKVMREDLAEDLEFLHRFKGEATAPAALSHVNIVRFYSFGREGHLAFIVMDFIPGTTLRRRTLEAGETPLPLDEVLSATRQVCAALHYGHGENVLHRDMKPGNIVIQPDMTAHGGGIYVSICGDSSYYVRSSEEDGDQGSWEGDLLPAPNFTAPVEGETIYWDRGPKCDAEQEDVRFFWTEVRPDDLWEDATVKYIMWCFVAHEGEWQGGWQQCDERYHNFCYVSPDSIRELMALDPIDNPNSYAKWEFSCGVVLAKGSTPPLTHISEKSFVQFCIEQTPCPEIQ